MLPLLNGLEHVERIRASTVVAHAGGATVVAGSIGSVEASSPEPGVVEVGAASPRIRARRTCSDAETLERALAPLRGPGSSSTSAATSAASSGRRLHASPRSRRPRRRPGSRSERSATTRRGVAGSSAPSRRRARSRLPTGCCSTPAGQWAIIDGLPHDLTTSTARDARAGRPTELDAIAGSVVRAGERLGVADAGPGRPPGGGDVPSAVALIGARGGSERVPGKNVRPLAGHPLLAYAIETARQSGVFERVIVSTDSEPIAKVARWYGADVPFLRPAEYATATSPDIDWIAWTLPRLEERFDLFAIVRATNPFRGPEVIRRGLDAAARDARGRLDPRRRAREAAPREDVGPRRSRTADAAAARPVAPRRRLARGAVPGAAAGLRPEQRARDRVDAGRRGVPARARAASLAPFLTEGYEGLNIDDEDDLARAEQLVAGARASLPVVERTSYPVER